MCVNVIRVSVYLQNWSHVTSYVNKATATPGLEDGAGSKNRQILNSFLYQWLFLRFPSEMRIMMNLMSQRGDSGSKQATSKNRAEGSKVTLVMTL